MNEHIAVKVGSLALFQKEFSCRIATLPANVVLLGWVPEIGTWYCAPSGATRNPVFAARIPGTLSFLARYVMPHLPAGRFWTMLCFDDGWRERNAFSDTYRWIEPPDLSGQNEWRGAPGELPILSPDRRWIACFCAHRGDPSALLVPEAHYVSRNLYRDLFAETARDAVPWDAKRPQAIYCGGNHGETANYFPPHSHDRPHHRQYLGQLVADTNLPVEVHLGRGIPPGRQTGYKYILDVDGYVRTWDAWAWKMHSGSTVLSVESPWESFFTRQFEPWTHFVPVANDLSDLADRLAWCRDHDAECRAIAARAKLRAQQVYRPEHAAELLAGELRGR